MLTDLVRFYRQAPLDAAHTEDEQISLGDYLERSVRRCLSRRSPAADGKRDLVGNTSRNAVLSAAAFIRFHDNHGLLQLEPDARHGRLSSAAAATMSSG